MRLNLEDIKSFVEEPVEEIAGDGLRVISWTLPNGQKRYVVYSQAGPVESWDEGSPTIVIRPMEIKPIGVQPTFLETVVYGSRGGG